jgi:hypothetical protein
MSKRLAQNLNAEFAEGAEHLILQEFAESAEKLAESLRVLRDLL